MVHVSSLKTKNKNKPSKHSFSLLCVLISFLIPVQCQDVKFMHCEYSALRVILIICEQTTIYLQLLNANCYIF